MSKIQEQKENEIMAGEVRLSVVIPTLNDGEHLGRLLPVLMAAKGLVDEVVVADGGSSDGSVEVARRGGARVVESVAGRGVQLRCGAEEARGSWLLFWHADTVPWGRWRQEVEAFMSYGKERLGVFHLRYDENTEWTKILSRGAEIRTRELGLPYGDQGFLIHRALYMRAGGFKKWPLMEDVGLVLRVGPHRVKVLEKAWACTSARRYKKEKRWWIGGVRTWVCLCLFSLGVPVRVIAKIYGR